MADPEDVEVVVDAAIDDKAIEQMFDVSKKKKKKKKKKSKKKSSKTESVTESNLPTSGKSADTGIANYEYSDLLDRVYASLKRNNPDLTVKKRYVLKPPQVMRIGTTRTCWFNFTEICQLMKRTPEHVLAYFLAELGTEGSIDGNARFVMKGKYVPKKIESLLRKYINEYVTCAMCRSPATTLTRDSVSRLYFVNCTSCGASRAVSTIKSGFHAVKRGERRKARG